MGGALEPGRDAFARQAWADAYRCLGPIRETLGASDLERLAVAAYLLGEDDESAAAWEAAHRRHADADNPDEAARCSFWLALCLLLRGKTAQASGWLSRTEGILNAAESECAAAGYLLIPAVLAALDDGDPSAAAEMARQAIQIGDRFNDADLMALATLGHGQALVGLGDPSAGSTRFDEVMVSVTAGETGPITSGIVYSAVILECMNLFDMPRASEWTDALTVWCDAQPDLVPYRGQCLVHRSQIQQSAGAWPDAMRTAESARERLADPPHPALGMAYYQTAELHRLFGAHEDAEAGYREANRCGYPPMPGLALLELDRGNARAAAAAVRNAVEEAADSPDRPVLLAAAVSIYLAIGATALARTVADELTSIASASSSTTLKAMARQADGSVLLGEGHPSAARQQLRGAASTWRRLDMPYEQAQTAVLIGRSCASLGDTTIAALEFETTIDTFRSLGAVKDLERVESMPREGPHGLSNSDESDDSPKLSAREREVLGHVAAGMTNREIAVALVISQHTVGRHLENIFAKLGVSSRAAATAYAYEHNLL